MTTTAAMPTRLTPPRVPNLLVEGLAVVAFLLVAAAKWAGLLPMTGGEVVVIGLRLAVPLLILRHWLVGGVVAMLLDGADVIIVDLIGLGGFRDHYAETDKLLDSYYYVLELIVALRWASPWLRVPAVALFFYRLVGAVLFEITHDHIVLVIFPNMFENWWLYCVVVAKWFPSALPSGWKNTLVPLAVLLVPKMAQEYLLHFAEAHPWGWTKEHVLNPIGIKP